MRLAGEATTEHLCWWAVAMIGTALDTGISERQIRLVLEEKNLTELIRLARESPDPQLIGAKP